MTHNDHCYVTNRSNLRCNFVSCSSFPDRANWSSRWFR